MANIGSDTEDSDQDSINVHPASQSIVHSEIGMAVNAAALDGV